VHQTPIPDTGADEEDFLEHSGVTVHLEPSEPRFPPPLRLQQQQQQQQQQQKQQQQQQQQQYKVIDSVLLNEKAEEIQNKDKVFQAPQPPPPPPLEQGQKMQATDLEGEQSWNSYAVAAQLSAVASAASEASFDPERAVFNQMSEKAFDPEAEAAPVASSDAQKSMQQPAPEEQKPGEANAEVLQVDKENEEDAVSQDSDDEVDFEDGAVNDDMLASALSDLRHAVAGDEMSDPELAMAPDAWPQGFVHPDKRLPADYNDELPDSYHTPHESENENEGGSDGDGSDVDDASAEGVGRDARLRQNSFMSEVSLDPSLWAGLGDSFRGSDLGDEDEDEEEGDHNQALASESPPRYAAPDELHPDPSDARAPTKSSLQDVTSGERVEDAADAGAEVADRGQGAVANAPRHPQILRNSQKSEPLYVYYTTPIRN
jgi:hypothetical protein